MDDNQFDPVCDLNNSIDKTINYKHFKNLFIFVEVHLYMPIFKIVIAQSIGENRKRTQFTMS